MVEMTTHGILVRDGVAHKGDQTLAVSISPEGEEGQRCFVLRSTGPDFGLDAGGRFATEDQAMDYAESLADAWQAD